MGGLADMQQPGDAIFCYSFRELNPSDSRFGGFSINLFQNHCLVYNTYDMQRRITGEQSFMVGPEVVQRYLRMVNYAYPWLRRVPDRVVLDTQYAQCESSFGFAGCRIFRMEDMDQLLGLPFGSQRGHIARQVYGLLENVASILNPYGFEMSLDGFQWRWDAEAMSGNAMQA